MRDILFRGFSKRADGKDKIVIGDKLIYGEWVFGFPFRDRRGKWKIRWYDEEYKSSKVSIVIPETVGQYIGICDKNEREIFEGDIVDLTDTWFGGRGVVKYKDGCWVSTNEKWSLALTTVNPDGRPTIEVIGNIYDNPELIEHDTIFSNQRECCK